MEKMGLVFLGRTKVKTKEMVPVCMAVAIVAVMTAAAELLGEKEIIFPEIAAVAAGGLVAPKLVWNTNKRRILLFIMICAVLGVGIVRYVPLPLWAQMAAAFLVSQIIFIYSGTTFAPMISAIVLPVMLQTETAVYLASAFLLTALILLFRLLLEKQGVLEEIEYKKEKLPQIKEYKNVALRVLVASVVIFAAVSLDAKFVVAPPLLVAFTEFSKPSCGARKRPVKAVALTGGSALIGAVFRYVFCIQFGIVPLYLAAAATMLAVLLVMKKLGMFLPPAGAVSILAMLIPEGAVLWFPVQITIGAVVAMGAALLIFREDTRAKKPEKNYN